MLTLWSGCSKSGGGVKLHTDTDSVAYVIGLNVGANLLKMDSTLNAAAVCKGIADYFAGRQSMTMEEAQTFYLRYVNYAVPEKIREQERRFLDDVTSGQGFSRAANRACGTTLRATATSNGRSPPTRPASPFALRRCGATAERFTPPTSVAIRCARALIRFPRGCARG